MFWGPCHCGLGPRLPIHFVFLVCFLSLCGHPTRDDDRLPPQHGGEDASAAVEGGFGLGSSSASGACLWSSLAFLPPNSCLAHRRLSLDSSCRRPSFRRRSFLTISTASWIPSFRRLWCIWSMASLWPRAFAAWEAEYVFIRRDVARPSLTSLYDGPYRVVHRSKFQHVFSPRYR